MGHSFIIHGLSLRKFIWCQSCLADGTIQMVHAVQHALFFATLSLTL